MPERLNSPRFTPLSYESKIILKSELVSHLRSALTLTLSILTLKLASDNLSLKAKWLIKLLIKEISKPTTEESSW